MWSFLFSPLLFFSVNAFAAWSQDLRARFATLDQSMSGELGVYVKQLSSGEEVRYRADRPWYLSSTTKVPVAIRLLQKVEAGEIDLEQRVRLDKADWVDGAGEVQTKPVGTQVSVGYLLEKMLTQSDSTAADILIRLVGLSDLNSFLQKENPGFRPFTTILQVRYDAYGELHPRAGELSNLDFLAMKRIKNSSDRKRDFARRLDLKETELRAESVPAAFERYYDKRKNSATLPAYGQLLERLATGKLLNAAHTALVLDLMEKMTTGEHRLKAGFPAGTTFAQKTGTQIGRICNVGIVEPEKNGVVVVACVEKFGEPAAAENLLKKVGLAMTASGAVGRQAGSSTRNTEPE